MDKINWDKIFEFEPINTIEYGDLDRETFLSKNIEKFSYYRESYAGGILSKRDKITINRNGIVKVEPIYNIYRHTNFNWQNCVLNSFGKEMFNLIEEGYRTND